MHHYEHNIGNWRRRTANLSLIEKGIYREFIDTYYLDETPLSVNKANLMRSHGIRTPDEKEAAEYILEEFFFLKDDGYHHPHCDEVLEKIYQKSKKAKQSALVKWIKRYEREGNETKAAEKQAELDAILCERIPDASKNSAFAEELNALGMLPITHNPITHNPLLNITEATIFPDDFVLTEDMEIFAMAYFNYKLGRGMHKLDPSDVFSQFKNYYKSMGSKFIDWHARWKLWLMDEKTLNRNNKRGDIL